MSIPLIGYNAENIGDKQYLTSFSFAFGQKFIPYNEFEGNLDVAVLGGGNVGYPTYLRIIEKFKKKVALSIGLNENSDFNKLAKFDKIIVRDYKSLELLREHKIDGSYSPDFSFMLYPDREQGKILLDKLFEKHKVERYKKVVALVFNSNLLYPQHPRSSFQEYEFQYFIGEMSKICDNISASFVFIPFGTQILRDEDRIINGMLMSKCKWWKKNICIFDLMHWKDALDILAAVNLTIGMRLHSLIFSFLGLTPFIGISIDLKINEFCRIINETRCYNHNEINFRALKEIIIKDLDNEISIRASFSKRKWEQLKILRQEIDKIKELKIL